MVPGAQFSQPVPGVVQRFAEEQNVFPSSSLWQEQVRVVPSGSVQLPHTPNGSCGVHALRRTHTQPPSGSLQLQKHLSNLGQLDPAAQQMATSPGPVPQTNALGQHPPLTQVVPSAQRLPQLPQFASSVARSVHVPRPQSVCPVGQVPPPWHTPFTHSCPAAQRLKHSPQLFSFICRFTHLSPQQVRPVGQPQILPSPLGFLMQRLEQHWRSPVHLRP
jgi:hypothetical protein